MPVPSVSNNLITSGIAESNLPSTSDVAESSGDHAGLNTVLSEILSGDESDSDFDPDHSVLLDPDAMIGEFTADWVASL